MALPPTPLLASLSLLPDLPPSPLLSSLCSAPPSAATPAPASLLATHRLPALSCILFQSSNPPLARSRWRLLSPSPSPLRHHLQHFCTARAQQEDALPSQCDQSGHPAAPNYVGRSKRSGKDFGSSGEDSEASQGSISKREFPWDSEKPSDLPFDLQTPSPESFPKESSALPLVIVKNNSQLPTFVGRSRLRAPWNESTSQRPAIHKIPLAGGQQHILEELKEKLEFEGEDEGFYEKKGEKSAMTRLVDKLRTVDDDNGSAILKKTSHSGSGASLSSRLANGSSSLFEREDIANLRFPWDKEEKKEKDEVEEKTKRLRAPYQAEIVLSEYELKRLRNLSLRATFRLKVGKDGVTDSVVESIHQHWRQAEVVRIKCEGPPAFNMKKTHEELEGKTGGLVIWRSGSAITVYRGRDYVFPSLSLSTRHEKKEEAEITLGRNFLDTDDQDGDTHVKPVKNNQGSSEENFKEDYEQEIEALLDGLGPRFECWAGPKPVPIDGDLLPAIDPNFKPPLRQLPYRVREKLSNTELTALRRLARPLPPHFVLGRNVNLEGLAGAILKLWEKSEVVKISVKRGVQNTRNERMAEELKRLTGGILLARDKYFITFYRGKDFLPPAVAVALKEREALANALQEDEETKRMVCGKVSDDVCLPSNAAGTLSEVLEVKLRWESWRSNEELQKDREAAVKTAQFYEVQSMERKLKIASLKKQKAELELAKVQKFLAPLDAPADREAITDEEKFMFRKLGLRMKAFLLIGRRGVFDGVVENMHLHWKHRELVKLILKERDMVVCMETARMLEYESGGILIAVVTVSKGQAIIVYRGKNYSRPPQLRPKNLLTKRKALKQSIEQQRRKSLENHIADLEKEIRKIKYKYDLCQEGSIKDSTSGFRIQGHELDVNEPDMAYGSSAVLADEDDVVGENVYFDNFEDLEDDEGDVVNLAGETLFEASDDILCIHEKV